MQCLAVAALFDSGAGGLDSCGPTRRWNTGRCAWWAGCGWGRNKVAKGHRRIVSHEASSHGMQQLFGHLPLVLHLNLQVLGGDVVGDIDGLVRRVGQIMAPLSLGGHVLGLQGGQQALEFTMASSITFSLVQTRMGLALGSCSAWPTGQWPHRWGWPSRRPAPAPRWVRPGCRCPRCRTPGAWPRPQSGCRSGDQVHTGFTVSVVWPGRRPCNRSRPPQRCPWPPARRVDHVKAVEGRGAGRRPAPWR